MRSVPLRRGRTIRRSAVGVPVALVGVGATLWLLGLTPLPGAPAATTDLLGMARRATVMGHGMPWQSLHVPRLLGWTRAHLRRRHRRAGRAR